MTNVDDFRLPDTAPEPPDPIERAKSVLDTGLPADVASERTLLGAVLLDESAFNDVAERLVPEDFSLDSHRRIFLRMCETVDAGQHIDMVTLMAELVRHKELSTIGGAAYLAELTEGLPRKPIIGEYIRICKDKSVLRQIMSISSAAIARAADQSETSAEILNDVENQILEITGSGVTQELRTVADSIFEAGGPDEYMAPIMNPVEQTGLLTGFRDYDAMTGGLQKSELTVIAARPSLGKTGLMANILQNVCIGTEFVAAFFSLEMSRSAIERRLLASIARVDVRRAMSGQFLSQLEKDKLNNALSLLAEAHLYIDDSPALTPTQLRAKARRLKQKYGRLDLLACDYLQLLDPGRKVGNEQEGVSVVSRALKACAKELDTSVVALAQLNRNNEARQSKRPVLSDLRSSGQIEQDADVVVLLHRDSYYEPENEDVRGLADLILAKHRNGGTGTIKLAFQAEIVRFDNLSTRV